MAKKKDERNREIYHAVNPDLFNNQEKISVCLIGCGGTGSHILTRLALLNYALLEMDYKGLDVIVYDDDIVEQNNIGRQMFTKSNIGENKAKCAVGKINMAFGYNWQAIDKKFKTDLSYNIVITAVDNIKTRKNIESQFFKLSKSNRHINKRPIYWIDAGNGKDFGQVVITDVEHTLMNIFDISDNIEADDKNIEVQGVGCSYADKLQEQGLFVNTDMAQIVGSILETMFIDRVLFYNVVYSNLKTMQRISALKFAL